MASKTAISDDRCILQEMDYLIMIRFILKVAILLALAVFALLILLLITLIPIRDEVHLLAILAATAILHDVHLYYLIHLHLPLQAQQS